MIAFVKIIAAPGVKWNSGSWEGTGVVFPTLNPSKLPQQGDGELLAESSFYISDTISFYMQTSLFLNHVQRTIDPVLVDPHDLFFTWSHIGLYCEKMKLFHVLEVLTVLYLKCTYYMNHHKKLEFHLVHLNL